MTNFHGLGPTAKIIKNTFHTKISDCTVQCSGAHVSFECSWAPGTLYNGEKERVRERGGGAGKWKNKGAIAAITDIKRSTKLLVTEEFWNGGRVALRNH